MTLDRRQITHYRLLNQQIARSGTNVPGEVVAALGAMQAQDYAGALWAIGLRLPSATEANIERAIADRAIIRTWPMRGTLHFVAAADVRWMLELLTPRVVENSAGRLRQLEIDNVTLASSRDMLERALVGGKQLTRGAIFALLDAAGIATTGQRGYHILSQLGQAGQICFGVQEGKQPTFTLLREWAPNATQLDRDEALTELAKRYFTSHGPATLRDFVRWTGLKTSDARTGLTLAADQLVREASAGVDYWLAPSTPTLPAATSDVYLLPGFDEYMLGYADRSAALDPEHAQKIIPGNNGVFQPTIIIDGKVAGVWKRAVKKHEIVVTVSPFAALNKAEEAGIAAAAERYGQFMRMPIKPDLTVVV